MKDIRQPANHRVRGPGRLAALLMAVAVMLGLSGGAASAAPDEHRKPSWPVVRVPDNARDAVAQMQPSWNLGNTLDAIPNEGSWGNGQTTKATFDTIAAQGFRSVRIPVTWSDHQSTTAPYTVDATYLARVKQIVDWALADGLYVVLNVHHDSWMWVEKITSDHDNVLARFNSTWSQIATTFRDEPRSLVFEGINEPSFAGATTEQKLQYLRELQTSFHSVVRASGGANASRMLSLTTPAGSPDQAFMEDLYSTIASLNDRQLIAQVHFYSWYPFSVNVAGGTHYDATAQKNLDDTFANIRSSFVARGIPVYIGEYGLLGWPNHFNPAQVERGEALKYFEHVNYTARTIGVTTALWDAFNFLNRDTLQWRDQALFDWIKSSWTTRSGTASFDKVFVPKSTPITAKSLTLNLNGTSFRGVWQGGTKLAAGRDYTVSGNQLTFTAKALTRLVGNRAYGVNATLRAKFTSGLPWNIDIVTNDAPTVSAATGTTDAFAVPTQYRGNDLATMHATYADGTNAGPTNWTPYQEFNQAFSPDYPNSAITLTPAFLAALRDGDTATLVFHFYSGDTATYRVTKSGTTVTGTVA
ncbi:MULTISPECIES: cellulase family glycosylhydrolase [unclassified Kitasatospora]|uniref:cellulase family glycosylhydrolase n=1 Tax=unclassified Kitasatospora TaxID=2633591 RepID=UPI00070AC75A|nr:MULTISPECIES: cellulase family glycosylhydrolase [unclassified Kitasatospora]KQV14607.1 cellulase [Kitasatospora sp. Root107]KRB72419.1 cellulase [Kitasatospora sp. Root187]